MPSPRVLESFVFGGVDGRSNPLAFPPSRSLRCVNFCPQPSQYLKLRYGYSVPTVGAAVPVPKFAVFAQGYNLVLKVDNLGIISILAGETSAPLFSGDGGLATLAGFGESGKQGLFGIVGDAAWNIYIADGSNRIRVVNHQTTPQTFMGVSVPPGCIDTVVGTGTAGYSGDGGSSTSAEINISAEQSLAIDPTGTYLYFCAGGQQTALFGTNPYVIRRVNISTGIISTVVGSGVRGYDGDGGSALSAKIDDVEAICFDPAGNLYLLDTGAAVIRRVDHSSGIITTILGNPGGSANYYTWTATTGPTGPAVQPLFYSGDGGPAANATGYLDTGLTSDPAGNIYFTDDSPSFSYVQSYSLYSNTQAAFPAIGYTIQPGFNSPALAGHSILVILMLDMLAGGVPTQPTIHDNSGAGNVYTLLLNDLSGGSSSTGYGAIWVWTCTLQATTGPSFAITIQGGATAHTISQESAFTIEYAGGTISGLDSWAGNLGNQSSNTNASVTTAAATPDLMLFAATTIGAAPTITPTLFQMNNSHNAFTVHEQGGPGSLQNMFVSLVSDNTYLVGPGQAKQYYNSSGGTYPSNTNSFVQAWLLALHVNAPTNPRVRCINMQSTTQTLLNVSINPGYVRTVAGGAASPGCIGDGGQATSAQFAVPQGISCDSNGTLYIADEGENGPDGHGRCCTVRTVDSTGTINTVAGTGNFGFVNDNNGSPAIDAQIDTPWGVWAGWIWGGGVVGRAPEPRGAAIHTAFYFESVNQVSPGGNPELQAIYSGAGTNLYQLTLGAAGNSQTQLSTLAGPPGATIGFDGYPWGAFVANNKAFFCDGPAQIMTDGTVVRPSGIRAPNSAETAGVSVALLGNWGTSNVAGGGTFTQVHRQNDWSSLSNLAVHDGAYATAVLYGSDDTVNKSSLLQITNFGFALPSDAVITGVVVSVIREQTAGTSAVFDDTVTLLGVGTVTDHAKESTPWNPSEDVSYGTPTDTWGATALTAANVNASTFGVQIGCECTLAAGGGTGADIGIDYVSIQIYYSASSGVGGGGTATVSTIAPWSPTTLTGYRFAMAYYNPLTGHVGNYAYVGQTLTIPGTGSIVQINGLPDLSSVNTEWVKLLGRTYDGATIPYALDDPISGTWVVSGNSDAVATLVTSSIDNTSPLPTRNGLPPSSHAACYALGRVYWIDDADPHLIDYSESESDLYGASSYVGRPEESWAPLSQIPFPKNETCRGIHEFGNEVWVQTRNFLGILTELGNYSPDGVPSPQFRGTWVGGGICGQRAFTLTPYGPYWVTPQRELMTWGLDGPIPVSTEYQAALIAQLATKTLNTVELSYLRDPERDIDRLYIAGADKNGNQIFIVHDFLIPPTGAGEGYQYQYTGIAPTVFVRQPDDVISMRDTDQRWRLWAASGSNFYQLEDGSIADGNATYTGDYITLFDMGVEEPVFAGMEISGDPKVVIQGAFDQLGLTTAQIQALASSTVTMLDTKTSRMRVEFDQGAQFALLRLQLTAHPADGYSLDNTIPPNIPVQFPGRIYVTRPEFGRGRGVGGMRP